MCTAAVAAFIDADRERHRLNHAQTGGDPAPDGSSHAFSPLPCWSAAGVSGGKWAGSVVMRPAAAERRRRGPRDNRAEQGTRTWVCTAAVVALIVAVSVFAETPPMLTARDVQYETQRALALLSHAARAAGRRERVEPGASSQSVAWGATAEHRGRRPRDGQNEQGTHAWVCTAAVAAFIDADRGRPD